MHSFANLLPAETLAQAETWLFNYLLNALWQLPLLFAAAWLAARASRRAGPAFQHAIWTSTLLAEVLLPACTARPDQSILALIHWFLSLRQNTTATTAHVDVIMGPARAAEGLQLAPTLLHTVVLLYLCAVAYFSARLAIGMYRTNWLYLRAEPYTLTGSSAQSFHRFARLFAVPNALVADSAEIAGPITLGIRRPVLLLPPALEADLLPEDFDAALAHEFAHMRRRDFAKNLAYELLSLPIAFHPILQLTRRHIAESRELICDAMAAHAVAGKQRYARSLLRLAAKFSEEIQPPTPHAIGFFDTNPFRNFERRVMNLTTKPNHLKGPARLALTALSLILLATACTSALAFRLQVATPAPQTSTPQPTIKLDTPPIDQTAPATIQLDVPRSDLHHAPSVAHVVPDSNSTTPSSFVLAIPRSDVGKPAPTIKVDVAGASNPNPIVKVLTPAYVESPQTSHDRSLQVTSNVLGGNVLNHTNPVYPPEAKAAGIQGAVVFNATIGKDGTLTSLKLISGPPELTKAAWEAVKQWTWKPYLLNGDPVAVDTTLTINFTLNPDAKPSPTPAPAPTPNAIPQPTALYSRPVVIRAGDLKLPTGLSNIPDYFITGDVRISLVVGKDGVPKDVAVAKGIRPDVDAKALEAVREYLFKPALLNGNPVEAKLFIDVNFQTAK